MLIYSCRNQAFLAFQVALHAVPYQTAFPLIFGIYVVFADLFHVYLALFIFLLAVFGNSKLKQLTKINSYPVLLTQVFVRPIPSCCHQEIPRNGQQHQLK